MSNVFVVQPLFIGEGAKQSEEIRPGQDLNTGCRNLSTLAASALESSCVMATLEQI